MQVKDL